MAKNRRPLTACIHVIKSKSGRIGDGEPELLGEIAQALIIDVTIARRKPAMLPKEA